MRRYLVSVLLLALAGATQGCTQQSQAAAPPPVPANEVWITQKQATEAKLTVAPAEDHDVGGTIVASGKVSFDDLRVSHIFSPVVGRVTKIEAQLGEKVKKGQVLALIDSPDLGMASSDVAKADADVIAAEHDFKRNKELYAEHAAAQKDYEASEDNYRKARAELDRARQKARLFNGATNNVVGQGYALRSLIDGEVVTRSVNPGMEVQGQYSAGSAVELFTIGDIDRVWVLADIFEMDLAKVKVGQSVSVKVVAYDKKFDGKVDWVSDALDPTTRTVKVRCTIPNPDHLLKPEMFATVSIGVATEKKLSLARGSVLFLGDATVAFVQVGETPDQRLRFERRPIAVDADDTGDWLPVSHGVKAGEQVVTSGALLLSGS